jgi:hypothetical protein
MFFRKRCRIEKGVFLQAVATYAAGGSTSSDGMRAVIPYVRTYEPVPCWLPVGARRANSGGRAAWRVERARPCGT